MPEGLAEKLGVAPERLVAYGLGETRPLSRKRPQNRRVMFRVLQGDHQVIRKRGVRAATEWGQAAVVGLWGTVEWMATPETDAPR